MRISWGMLAACIALQCGCSEDEPSAATTTIHMEFDAEPFYAAPFPSEHRRNADGRVNISSFPNPGGGYFATSLITQLDGRADGFSTTAAVYFSATGPLDAQSLGELHGSLDADAPVFLMSVDPDAPDYLSRHPITVHYEADGGPFGAAHLLSVLPLQGRPLHPGARYAAVVTTAVRGADGAALAPAASMQALLAGNAPTGLDGAAADAYRSALAALDEAGVARSSLVAMAAFTTWDPTAELDLLVADARTRLEPPLAPLALTDTFDEMCVYASTIHMPVYQSGEPPYQDEGGEIVFEDGAPIFDHLEEARIVVTVPRAPMPGDGWPVALMSRTGGGADIPLVERGVRDENGEVAVAGTGPGLHFARAGFAGATVDGPHGGMRNITGGDEQFLIFNISNPTAMRDNVRQSALELALMADVLDQLDIDVAGCPGSAAPGDSAQLDVGRMALMGHSMGATIAPLTLAAEPRFGAAILSGAGGSWIENIVHKQSPLVVRPLADIIVGYTSIGRQLHEHDPVLNLLQWAGEPADPPVYAQAMLQARRDSPHLLVFQGIVDSYILPPIANSLNLSLELDLGGEALDEQEAELAAFRPLRELLPYSGGEQRDLPASANRDATALVVQHRQGPIEDGHEVMFQLQAPKHQYRCFLSSWLAGAPQVPAAAMVDAACPP